MRAHALSTFVILWFVFTTMGIPLLVTCTEAHPIRYNLKVPVLTYSCMAIAAATLVTAHWLYRIARPLQLLRAAISQKIFVRIGLFQQPTPLQLWLIGGIGSLAMFYSFLVLKDDRMASEGTISRFMEGVSPFAYAPFLMILPSFKTKSGGNKVALSVALTVFFGLILVLAMGRGNRGTLGIPIETIGLAYFVGLLSSGVSLRNVKWNRVIPIAILAVISFNIFVDLATAMVIARGARKSSGYAKVIQITVDLLSNPEMLENYREQNKSGGTADWDETYLGNPVFARLCNLKFHDNVFALIDPSLKAPVVKWSEDTMLAQLPQPILTYFDLSVDKVYINSMSFGDYILYLNTRNSSVLGTHRVGSMMGHGVLLLGIFYWPVLGALGIVMFILFDSFSLLEYVPATVSRLEQAPQEQPTRQGNYRVAFAWIAMMNMHTLMSVYGSESLIWLLGFLTRGMLQMLSLYLILYFGTRLVTGRR